MRIKKPILYFLTTFLFCFLSLSGLSLSMDNPQKQNPIEIYPAGDIHFLGALYRVTIEDQGRGELVVILHPQGISAGEGEKITLKDWLSFVKEVNRINSIVIQTRAKEIFTVKEFLEFKDLLQDRQVKVMGIARKVKIKKGILFYYTIFNLTDEEGNQVKVSWEGKHQIPKDRKVIVEGKYSIYGKELQAKKVTW